MPARISVCMATCNGDRYLREQMDSILVQLGPEDELVVSDDASTDDTLVILGSYNDERLRVLSGDYRDPVQNFANALRQARGEILVLSDQDDRWLPGRLELVRQYLAGQTGRPALIMMDGEIVDADGEAVGLSVFTRNRAGKGLLKNIYDNTYTGCCLAFSRPLLDIALPFPRHVPMHDMWLGLLAELFGRVEFVPVRTLRYRRHGANVSQRSPDLLLKVRRRFWLVLNLMGRYAKIRWQNSRQR
jgi:glycosyltransferase involved in cell wall biosynthesis